MQIGSLDSEPELRNYRIIGVKAPQNIDIGDDCRTEHDSEYSFLELWSQRDLVATMSKV